MIFEIEVLSKIIHKYRSLSCVNVTLVSVEKKKPVDLK
jgi:hypothetical protein